MKPISQKNKQKQDRLGLAKIMINYIQKKHAI